MEYAAFKNPIDPWTGERPSREATTAPEREEKQPSWMTYPAWYRKYLAGGTEPREDQCYVAVAAMREAADAFGLDKWPEIRFFDPRYRRADAIHPTFEAMYRASPFGGVIYLPSRGQSLRRLAEAAAHETAHAAHAQMHGPLARWTPAEVVERERQAHAAGDSFGDFLERCYGVFDEDLFSGPLAVRWARDVLYRPSRRRSLWTAPVSFTA